MALPDNQIHGPDEFVPIRPELYESKKEDPKTFISAAATLQLLQDTLFHVGANMPGSVLQTPKKPDEDSQGSARTAPSTPTDINNLSPSELADVLGECAALFGKLQALTAESHTNQGSLEASVGKAMLTCIQANVQKIQQELQAQEAAQQAQSTSSLVGTIFGWLATALTFVFNPVMGAVMASVMLLTSAPLGNLIQGAITQDLINDGLNETQAKAVTSAIMVVIAVAITLTGEGAGSLMSGLGEAGSVANTAVKAANTAEGFMAQAKALLNKISGFLYQNKNVVLPLSVLGSSIGQTGALNNFTAAITTAKGEKDSDKANAQMIATILSILLGIVSGATTSLTSIGQSTATAANATAKATTSATGSATGAAATAAKTAEELASTTNLINAGENWFISACKQLNKLPGLKLLKVLPNTMDEIKPVAQTWKSIADATQGASTAAGGAYGIVQGKTQMAIGVIEATIQIATAMLQNSNSRGNLATSSMNILLKSQADSMNSILREVTTTAQAYQQTWQDLG